MPIVISEFEIITEPSPPVDTASDRPRPEVQPPPTPYELATAVRHQLQRDARVRAD